MLDRVVARGPTFCSCAALSCIEDGLKISTYTQQHKATGMWHARSSLQPVGVHSAFVEPAERHYVRALAFGKQLSLRPRACLAPDNKQIYVIEKPCRGPVQPSHRHSSVGPRRPWKRGMSWLAPARPAGCAWPVSSAEAGRVRANSFDPRRVAAGRTLTIFGSP
jgi:hypothetical protein